MMFFSKSSLVALFASVATAAPVVSEMQFLDPRSSSNHVTLSPAKCPDVDGNDIKNLYATPGTKMHYDSDPDPSTDSTIATLSAPTAPYPIVMLEDSNFIKSTQCSNGHAHITFNDANAYKEALGDWQKQKEFIIITYNQDCGTGLDGKRDFAKVTKVSGNDATKVIDANIEYISYADAIGNSTVVRTTIGNYKAPLSKRISVHKSLSMKWDQYPTNALSDNQWGPGYQLMNTQKLDVICVGCGTKGDLELEGTVDFSIFHGFKDAKMSLKGNMEGSIALGLDAKGLSGTIPLANKGIAQIPIGGVSIPEVITIGPQIDISVGASITVEATGSLLVGATLKWPSVDMELVLAGDGDNKADGLTPDITPKHEIKGSVDATLDLHLPVSFGIGINILDGKWNKSVSVVDTPGFQLTGSKSNEQGACPGVGLAADLYNNVDFDILGLKSIGLASYTHTLFSTCLGGKATSSSASVPSSATAHKTSKAGSTSATATAHSTSTTATSASSKKPSKTHPKKTSTASPTPTSGSVSSSGKHPTMTEKPSSSSQPTYTIKSAPSTSSDNDDDCTETESETYSASSSSNSTIVVPSSTFQTKSYAPKQSQS